MMFLSLIFLTFGLVAVKSEICDIESRVSIDGQEHILIALRKMDCGSSGCIEILSESKQPNIKSHSKTCMSLAQLDTKLPMTEGTLVDVTKCNSNYRTQLKNLDDNSIMDVDVMLRCSQPSMVSPTAKFCDVQHSMIMDGNEQMIVPPSKIECPSKQCVVATTLMNSKTSVMKTIEKQCAEYLELSSEAQNDGPKVIDLKKCNSMYSTSLKMPENNEDIQVNVDLKCFTAA